MAVLAPVHLHYRGLPGGLRRRRALHLLEFHLRAARPTLGARRLVGPLEEILFEPTIGVTRSGSGGDESGRGVRESSLLLICLDEDR